MIGVRTEIVTCRGADNRRAVAVERPPAGQAYEAGGDRAAGLLALMLLVYALVKAPDAGWGNRHTIGELGTAAHFMTLVEFPYLGPTQPATEEVLCDSPQRIALSDLVCVVAARLDILSRHRHF